MNNPLMQYPEHDWREDLITVAESNIAAAILFHDLRIDVFIGAILFGIHMRDKADNRHWPGHVKRNSRHQAVMTAKRNLRKPQRGKLIL